MCSACAQTSGIAEPLGPPRQQLPLRDVGGPSHTCSGSSLPWLAHASSAASNRVGLGLAAGQQLVVRALAGQQRPDAADAGAVERRCRPHARRSRRRCSGASRARSAVPTAARGRSPARVSTMRGSSGARRPKRTRASASALISYRPARPRWQMSRLRTSTVACGAARASPATGGAMRM